MRQQKGIVLLTAIAILAAITVLILFLFEGTLLTTIETRNLQINAQLYQKSTLALKQLQNEISTTNVARLSHHFYPCLVDHIPEHQLAEYLATHWQNQYTKGCGGQILPFQFAYFIEQLNEDACAQLNNQGQHITGVRFYRLTFYSGHLDAKLHLIIQTTFALAVPLQSICGQIVRQTIRSGWLSWREIQTTV